MEPEITKEHWEHQHEHNVLQDLSGYQLPWITPYMHLEPYLVPGNTVLEIGVGTGVCTRELAAANMKVHCLDIAEKGLDKVRDVATCWLESQLEELPSAFFDLAISHLVTQHLNNRQLSRQLANVVRALKPTGVFAMQYAHPLPGQSEKTVLERPPTWSATRTEATMTQLVLDSGGVIVYHAFVGDYPEYEIGWSVVHVKGAQ